MHGILADIEALNYSDARFLAACGGSHFLLLCGFAAAGGPGSVCRAERSGTGKGAYVVAERSGADIASGVGVRSPEEFQQSGGQRVRKRPEMKVQVHNLGVIKEAEIANAIESLLFVSGRPLERAELRKLLDIDEASLAEALQTLANTLEDQGRGIRLQRLGEQVQLVTAPENARYVAALLGLPMTAKLTTAAMETLAVISYRQPVTRAQIESIRGVNSDRALASLIQHGLVAEVGRAQTVGRPALFATTSEFLQQFGLTSLEQLPQIEMREQGGSGERILSETQWSGDGSVCRAERSGADIALRRGESNASWSPYAHPF